MLFINYTSLFTKMAVVVRTPLALYRYLLRRIAILQPDMNAFYRHRIRQEFKSHADETEEERIKQIIEKAIQDIEWIVKRYQKT